MPFSLTILGSSAALPTSERYSTAQVLDVPGRFFLIDCGEGTQIQLRRNRIKLSKISDIFISHLHGDHFFGLPGLISTLSMLGKKGELNIHAPKGLKPILDSVFTFAKSNFSFSIKYNFLEDYESGEAILDDKSIEVTAFRLKHSIPSFGFSFKEKHREMNIKKEKINEYNLVPEQIIKLKRGDNVETENGILNNDEFTFNKRSPDSFAFVSDTMYCSDIVPFIKGVKVLYHEATYMNSEMADAKKTMHSTTQQAADIAQKAGAQNLLIGHFSSRYKNIMEMQDEARQIFKKTYAVEENKTFDFSEF